jgi:hypothetical protein
VSYLGFLGKMLAALPASFAYALVPAWIATAMMRHRPPDHAS